MRSVIFMLGAAAAIGMAAAVSAAPIQGGIQLAQAQESGTQSGAGKATNQRGNAGNREGGGATRESKGGDTASGGNRTVRGEGASRTSVHGRSEESRVSVHGGTHGGGTHVRVGAAEHDGGVIVRHRRYVYDEPATVIKRKRYHEVYREPSHHVVIRERHEDRGGVAIRERHEGRGGVAVSGSVNTRGGGSATVGRSTTHTNGGTGANVRSGGANSGGSTGGRNGQSRGGTSRSGSSGSGSND